MSKERAAQLVDAGIWLKLSGDREGARKLFERALKLDPENQKAAQLLAGGDEPPPAAPEFAPSDVVAPPIAPVSTSPSSPPVNPFEPPAASPPSPNEREWELATRKPAPAPLEPSLDADWGRLTGASTPIPQNAPAGSEAAPKTTLPAWGSTPSSTIRIGSNTPAPQIPPVAPVSSSPSAPRNPTMMQWNSPVPQSSPSSSGSGVKKQTMSDWSTQVPGRDSPPPIRPAGAPADVIAHVVLMVISGESS
ncbi:MAG: tetratricopeptide repeat protein, partial [Archangium sp.]|nr:tetratricopeptide repeat protein [Archangium sp.]